jgi:GNAT superfamily N-acetyltransferase
VLYLEDLIVTEALRGKGAGKQLFEWCIEETKRRGFRRMAWQVLEWNEPSIEFYKRYGASFDATWLNATIDL